ncbi:MAG: glycosyltransferase family 39 protein [Alphaproteobacteria bacterium]|nr:glycosyltransferase family 39 protein [Alphaproteobacteria bacterium]
MRTATLPLIAISFLAVNGLLLWAADADTAMRHGADAASWLQPAQALLRHGAFVQLDDPSTLQTFRPPLYPLMLAGLLWLGGGSFLPLVLAQVVLLFLTGWLARAITEDCLPGYGDLALALVIFNPSALGTAHLVQSDTLYAFLVTATLWMLFSFARRPGWQPALAAGVLFGLACLVRTTGQFLLYVWPLAFPILAATVGQARQWKRQLAAGLASLLVAVLLLLPWMAHNHAAGEGFSLSTARLKSDFLWDQIAYLEKYDRGVSISEAEAAGKQKREILALASPGQWQQLSERQRYEHLVDHGFETFLSYPTRTFAVSFAWAWAQFFAIPGVSNLTNILALTEAEPFQVFVSEGSRTYLEAGLAALKQAHPAATVLTALGFLYVILLRALGLIGLGAMIVRRHWPQLLIVVGGIAYFALIHLFVANSRYRLPIEPLLVLLAIYGLDALRRRS